MKVGRRSQNDRKSPSEFGDRLSNRDAAGAEAARLEQQHFNHQHSDQATPDRSKLKLREKDGEAIFEQYRRGATVGTLVKQHHRSRTNIRRVVNEMQIRRIRELPIEFIPNPEFSREDAEATIMTNMPASQSLVKSAQPPAALTGYLASLYEVPLLTREQEFYLFRKFNYLKYQASELRRQLDQAQSKRIGMDRVERLFEAALAVKDEIVRANLRLVVSIAKRYVGPSRDLWELVSEGNISLLRAVEKFDFARGFRFSTYASWAIMRNFSRSIVSEQRQRDRFLTSQEDSLGNSENHRSDQYEQEMLERQRQAYLRKILRQLNERERQVLICRFGLFTRNEPQSFKSIGAEMGISKERVRQIQTRALDKLRTNVGGARIDMPEMR